jgi:hypothetical protein
MKIVITEAQYSKLTEDNLREFLYAFWDRQKKNGEEPFLDEMLYHVLGITKNTREDYQQVRPIWYRYNGGREVLYDKLVKEISDKTFRIQDDVQNLNADFKVVGFDSYELSIKMEVVLLMLDADGNGQIETTIYDDEDEEGNVNDENYRMELVSIYEALAIAREFYETGDLTGYLRSVAYDYFYNLLEKYGLPIDVEVDIR